MEARIDASRGAAWKLCQQIYILLVIEVELVKVDPTGRVRCIGPLTTSFRIAHIPQAEHAFVDGL